jgi:hypothetical protein
MRNHEGMRRAALAFAGSLAAASLAASATPAAVSEGTIVVNRGAAGITLGMTRAAIVNELGKPVDKNQNGWMAFAPANGDAIFDVYLNGRNRARLIGVSGESFCLESGTCMLRRNGVRKLREEFGDRLKTVEIETGESVLALRGRHRGHRVFTSFSTSSLRPRARILMTFIGRCPPKPTPCP